jgi:hypothetical protein
VWIISVVCSNLMEIKTPGKPETLGMIEGEAIIKMKNYK